MIRAVICSGGLMILASAVLGYATRAQTPQPDASDAVAKQIGWLVIQNAQLQTQLEALKKECPPKEAPKEMPK